jgi:two-component system CheB/CheR fusion protein
LEIELAETKRKLNKARVELETSNEELQTSNEELMSSNEELQSTNEELQSVNEELYTVNFELQEKNKELVELNTDINNIINSTEIGTLLLDTNLNIRKFTPAISKHFNLKEDDIGRPINIFAPKFGFQVKQSLEIDAKKVLESSIIIEKEIYDENHDKY